MVVQPAFIRRHHVSSNRKATEKNIEVKSPRGNGNVVCKTNRFSEKDRGTRREQQ